MAQRAALPLIPSGYFDVAGDVNFETRYNQVSRRRDFRRLLRDLGLRRRGGDIVVDRRDSADPFSAFAEGRRAALFDTVDSGFGTDRLMQRSRFAPIRQEITKTAQRAFGDLQFENQSDRLRRRRALAEAARGAARYGVESQSWTPVK